MNHTQRLERLVNDEIESLNARTAEIKKHFDADPVYMMTWHGAELVANVHATRELVLFRHAIARTEGDETMIREYAAEFCERAEDALLTFNLELSTNSVHNALHNEGGLRGRKRVLDIAKRIRRLA